MQQAASGDDTQEIEINRGPLQAAQAAGEQCALPPFMILSITAAITLVVVGFFLGCDEDRCKILSGRAVNNVEE